MKPQPRLPREVGDAPSLGTSQARLDGARSTQIQLEMSLPVPVGWTRWSLRSLPPQTIPRFDDFPEEAAHPRLANSSLSQPGATRLLGRCPQAPPHLTQLQSPPAMGLWWVGSPQFPGPVHPEAVTYPTGPPPGATSLGQARWDRKKRGQHGRTALPVHQDTPWNAWHDSSSPPFLPPRGIWLFPRAPGAAVARGLCWCTPQESSRCIYTGSSGRARGTLPTPCSPAEPREAPGAWSPRDSSLRHPGGAALRAGAWDRAQNARSRATEFPPQSRAARGRANGIDGLQLPQGTFRWDMGTNVCPGRVVGCWSSCPGQWGSPQPWGGSKPIWMWPLGTGFSRHGGVGVTVGLGDLRGPSQPG